MEKPKSHSYIFDASLARYGQVLLVMVVISVLMLMILPVPPLLLDLFLALNMIGALTVLMMALSVHNPMKLSSFPSLLLICTLFRLGLNVSSTRMILSKAQAGEIIQTFGYYVTAGNLMVGLIIFMVLLIIQFLVVAKGSERVAEVAARFTLDALPGKQMSIDADLRAGIITSEEAASRRSLLIKESKLYGSMDGAMKFVKGDTIAGFVITLINLLGGLIIGFFHRGMDLDQALSWYSLLTIGDGLVSQIPALMVSLAAGFMVTRVADLHNESSLGSDMGQQLLIKPNVLFMVSGFSVLLGLIPGFPTVLFFLIALGLMLFAGSLKLKSYRHRRKLKSIDQHRLVLEDDEQSLGYAEPFLLELGSQMYMNFKNDERWQRCFNILLPKLTGHMIKKYGVPFPELKIVVNPDLLEERYVIKVYEMPVDEGLLSPEHCVVPQTAQSEAISLGFEERSTETHHGTPILLLQLQRQKELSEQGFAVLAPEEMLLRHVGRVLKKHAADFIGIQEVRHILSSVERHHPELVREVVPRMLTIHKFTEVIRRLVDEGVPVRDFRLILETLSGSQPENKDAVDLGELVRLGLRRVITHQHVDAQNRLACFLLDPEIEDELEKHIQKNEGERYITLSPERIQEMVNSIGATYKNHNARQRDVVILTQVEVRRSLRKMIESDLSDISVLSFQELDPSVQIDQRDTISLNYQGVLAV